MRDSLFWLYATGTIVLISLSCYVEEWIFKQLPGFKFHWFVALVELLLFSVLGWAAPLLGGGAPLQRKGPLLLYIGAGAALAAGTGIGKVAFRYLNYTTGTILKSMKLLPVMCISVCWLRRRYSGEEYAAAAMMVTSAACFGLGEASVDADFNPVGIALALACLCAQAAQTNLQDRLLRDYDVSVHEAMLWANASGCAFVLAVCLAEGSLLPALAFFASPLAAALLLLRSLSFYAGALAYTLLLKHAGGVAAVAVGTLRKSLTVVLSFALFPKPWSHKYALGGALLLAALALDQRAHRAGGSASRLQRLDGAGEAPPAGQPKGSDDEELEPCVSPKHEQASKHDGPAAGHLAAYSTQRRAAVQ